MTVVGFYRAIERSKSISIEHISFAEVMNDKFHTDSLFIFNFEPEPLEVRCRVAIRFYIQVVVSVILGDHIL